MEFKGKVALVTGAGTGNGEAIAARLHAGGACVALVSRRLEQVESVSRSIDPEGARTVALEADVRDPKAMEGAVRRTLERFGKLDLAVNNAAITGPAGVPVQDLEAEIWREVIETDLTGIFYSMKYEIPAMLANGSGAIVNMSSANGLVGLAGMASYTAAKHGVIGLTRSAALELAESNIRVCAVAPGYVATPRIMDSGKEVTDWMAGLHPMKRLATREEVADLVAYLLSDRAAFMTGSVHSIDGGYTAQ
ncbi:MAG: SDR family NAD(P)-dependent oxidoreductase [Aminivibrio sp.]|jgi:NAD(P)-dependent dehydrogenase (short-subunit alcohol dehydrogenase family)|uniref:SDR family NAD(P)-dependent oxidoreductase n=1 Tax=Aminivibrio sp. TaxID=1872489 RepID=UPI002B21E232|nr:SDR family NAD(P)-dependent oxidoreductase [Aminivibrio sp.]MEA4953274.1 SDR family NAD(P)-dependent oxidoreductase [Aminivibrio sp.]